MLVHMRMLAGVVLVVLAGCPAPVGVENAELQPDSARRCAQQCASLQLELDSVVIMADNVGCVCRPGSAPPAATAPPGSAPTAKAGGTSGASGMVAIMLARKQQQDAQAAQAHQHSTKPPGQK